MQIFDHSSRSAAAARSNTRNQAEATRTHSNQPKPLVFEQAKADPAMARFLPLIEHVVVEDLPDSADSWELEHFQRNALVRGFLDRLAGAGTWEQEALVHDGQKRGANARVLVLSRSLWEEHQQAAFAGSAASAAEEKPA